MQALFSDFLLTNLTNIFHSGAYSFFSVLSYLTLLMVFVIVYHLPIVDTQEYISFSLLL